MSSIYDKPLPSLPESEKVVLGAILLDNALMVEAANVLTSDDFYGQSQRLVFDAMLSLFEQNAEITPVSIANELRRSESVELAGGVATITNLSYGLPRLSSLSYYAKQLRDVSERRRLIRFGNEIVSRGMDSDESNEELTEWAGDRLASYRGDTKGKRGPKLIGELIDEQLVRFEHFHHNVSDAVPTGFQEVDTRMTGGGLVRGFSHIIAARPSMGKTALMLDIAENAASAGFVVYIATLEMMNKTLLDRLFAIRAGVPRWKVSPGISDRDLNKLRGVADDFRPLTLIVDDSSRGIPQMRRAIRNKERELKRPVDLIIADYLQLMRTDKGGTRNDQVGANSRGWQELCIEHNTAGLLLSQLSRNHEQQGREPDLSDLRDSGEIEQDARAVFLLFGDKGEEVQGVKPPLYREITFRCAKQGEGKLFRVTLPFNTDLATFRSFGQITQQPTEMDPTWSSDYQF